MDVKKKKLVWDLPLRIFHWLLVTGIVAQWLTAEVFDDALQIHMYLGYGMLGLILFRLIWGLVGPRHSRFSTFLFRPSTILTYVKRLVQGKTSIYTGHNPAGSVMVVLMLMCIGLQALSGLFISDDVFYAGPYNYIEQPYFIDLMTTVHHLLFDVMLWLIALHILAVLWYQFRLRQPLIQAMFHGKKPVSTHVAIPHSQLLKALLICLLVAAVVYWLVEINPADVADDFYY